MNGVITWVKKNVTHNRIVFWSHQLATAAVAVAGLEHSLPQGWQNAAIVIAAVLAHGGAALKFLAGSQQWDALTAGQAPATPSSVIANLGIESTPADEVGPGDDAPPEIASLIPTNPASIPRDADSQAQLAGTRA